MESANQTGALVLDVHTAARAVTAHTEPYPAEFVAAR
jgi:hypothetical protein